MHPIGIIPKHLWDTHRYIGLDNAIYRYETAGFNPLVEWFAERDDLENLYPYFKDFVGIQFENPTREMII